VGAFLSPRWGEGQDKRRNRRVPLSPRGERAGVRGAVAAPVVIGIWDLSGHWELAIIRNRRVPLSPRGERAGVRGCNRRRNFYLLGIGHFIQWSSMSEFGSFGYNSGISIAL